MNNRIPERNSRADSDDKGTSQPVEVVAIHSGGTFVDVKPLQRKTDSHEPAAIIRIPAFALTGVGMFAPIKVGMRGTMINSTREVSEIGDVNSRSSNTDSGGFFIPTNVQGEEIDPDYVGLKIGDTTCGIENGKLVLIANGVNVLDAIKELSDDLGTLEAIIFTDGTGKTHTHGGTQDRLADDL